MSTSNRKAHPPRIAEGLLPQEGDRGLATQEAREALAAKAVYTGSPYHKTGPFGRFPSARPRPDASRCDGSWTVARATDCLRQALRAGHFDAAHVRKGWPKRVWHKDESSDTVYEAILGNDEKGEYHGYPLECRSEWPPFFIG